MGVVGCLKPLAAAAGGEWSSCGLMGVLRSEVPWIWLDVPSGLLEVPGRSSSTEEMVSGSRAGEGTMEMGSPASSEGMAAGLLCLMVQTGGLAWLVTGRFASPGGSREGWTTGALGWRMETGRPAGAGGGWTSGTAASVVGTSRGATGARLLPTGAFLPLLLEGAGA